MAEAIDEAEWRERMGALHTQLARMPIATPATLTAAKERLVPVHQVWVGMAQEEKREACRILFERVRMDTLNKKLFLEPWPEFQGLFAHRRDLCGLGTPGRGRTVAAHTNDGRWFAPDELIAV